MINTEFRFQLETRKLTGQRQQKTTCPSCGRKKCFVRYVDTKNGFQYIADEVGSSKIYAAWHGEDVTYIESPYSHMSITDFHNNIISIQNVYMGGVEGQTDANKSLHAYVRAVSEELDSKVMAAIAGALAKIDAMPAPFALHYGEAANGEAVEACAALSEAFDEVIEAIRNN